MKAINKRRGKGLWVGVLGLTALLLASTTASAAAPSGGTLRVATIGEPPSLDIQMVPSDLVSMITQHMFEQLFAFDATYNPVPMLADSYSVNDDGTRYTIRLRENVVFHDGSAMTSEDVVASLNRWGRVSSRGRIALETVNRITTPDEHTVVLELSRPFAPLISFLAFQNTAASIYPKEIAEAYPDVPIREYVGTGPYKFDSWAADYRIRLVRFEDYAVRTDEPSGFAGRKDAKIGVIEFYPVPEASTRIAGVQSGDYHYAMTVTTDRYEEFLNLPSPKPYVIEPGSFGWLIFNKQQGIATNVRLRQALLAATDVDPILAAAYGHSDFHSPEPSYYPPGTVWYSEAAADKYDQADLATARRLLEEAGYNGEPVRLVATREYEYMYQIALVAASQWQAAGVNVDLQIYDWATVVDIRGRPEAYDVFVTGHGFVPDPSLITILSSEYPGWWDSPEKNRLVAELNTTVDPAGRKAVWDSVQALIYDEVPVIRVGENFTLDLATADLEEYWPSPWPSFWNASLR